MMNLKNWIAILVFILCLIILLFPWQIILINQTFDKLYNLTLHIGYVLPMIYGIIRIMRVSKAWKWVFLIPAISITISALLLIPLKFIFFYSSGNLSDTIYSNPKNRKETISIINYSVTLDAWQETKHIINFSNRGFRLEKDFKQSDLEGMWYIHSGNMYSKERVAFFINGKELINDNE